MRWECKGRRDVSKRVPKKGTRGTVREFRKRWSKLGIRVPQQNELLKKFNTE